MSENKNPIHREVIQQVRTLMAAGFGFVAALAWNDAIQAFLKAILPHPGSGLVGKFVYASIVTVVLVAVTSRIKDENTIETK